MTTIDFFICFFICFFISPIMSAESYAQKHTFYNDHNEYLIHTNKVKATLFEMLFWILAFIYTFDLGNLIYVVIAFTLGFISVYFVANFALN
jgi:hypothetical protein